MKVYTIKDCPFCGSDNISVQFKDTWGIVCRTCRAHTTFDIVSESFDATIDAYNNRTNEGENNGNK